MKKIEKKFNSFIGEPIKDKNFKFKKLKQRKNNKEISFIVTASDITDETIKTEIKKLKNNDAVPPTNNKLNYYQTKKS